MTRNLPVFPLGRVFMPGEVLPLHVFEPRYRVLMQQLTSSQPAGELGVLLIERGHEVGGGDQRTSTGTIGRLLEATELPDGRWLVALGGDRRFRVETWLEDDPFPQALVEEVPEPAWDPRDDALLEDVEASVRAAIAMAGEMGEASVPAGFALAPDRPAALWELAALAPISSLDRQRLLETPNARGRLELLSRQVAEASEILAFRMAGG